jgi:hypothetical protein
MLVGENGFGFDPFQSSTVIRGKVSGDGRMAGTAARQGVDHQDLLIAFDGMTTGPGEVSGTLKSGRCRWAVTLHRG